MGTSFGRYKVAEELGRGAMGVVYRAVDPAIGRSVAIKAINRTYLESLGVKPEEYAERFQREAQVAGALNHPHIVKIFDLGADYLVMEYVEGQTLAEVLRAHGRLPRETALRVLGEAASALDHAHAAGIVHRDIKPANLMVQPNGSVKVMDFGLARIESSTLTAAGEVLGSAAYMAPEVVLGHPADARSDIFSLAVVAYELLTGTRPFAGPTVSAVIQSVVRTTPRPARELDATLPPETDRVFARALAKKSARRYDSAGEFVRALALAAWAQAGPEAEAAAAQPPVEPAAATIIMASASAIRPAGEQGGADQPAVTTVLRVDADELGQPAGTVDAAADTTRRAPPPPSAAAEAESASAEAARAPDEALSGDGTAATVILPAPVSVNHTADGATPATVVLKQPLAPGAPAGPAPAEPSGAGADRQAATVVMKTTPAGRKTTPAGRPPQPKDDVTTRMLAVPDAGPSDKTVVLPEPPPAAESPVTVRMTVEDVQTATAEGAPRAEPESTPATARLPVPPAATLPPPAVTPPAAPVGRAAPPPPAASARPAARPAGAQRVGARSPLLFIAGSVVVILLLFGAAVAGFFWLVRSRAVPDAAASPSPVAEPAVAGTPAAADGSTAATTPGAPDATTEAAATPAPAAPAPATLWVVSDPDGATVTIGRRRRGRTPLRLSLPAGALSVELQKDGYEPWRERTRLSPGETHRLHAELEPLAPAAPAATPKPAAQPAVREGDLVPLGPDVTPPRKLSGGTPTIPGSVRRNLSGSAVVEFTVEIDGSVSSPRIVESLGKVVDQAVLEVIPTWRYEPARKEGVRVRVVLRAKFTYVKG